MGEEIQGMVNTWESTTDVTEMLIRGAPRGSRGRKGGQAETRATRRRDASVSETLASRSTSMTAGEMKLFLFFSFFQCFYLFFLAKNRRRCTGAKR